MKKLLIVVFLIFVSIPAADRTSFASSIPISDELAIRAIMGEAENQGPLGMLAVAEAIRNRGTLRGVYGASSKALLRTSNANFELQKIAKQAWEESKQSNVTNGATNWENIHEFGTPYWVKNKVFHRRTKQYIYYKIMIKTVEIKDHVFYKEKIIREAV